MTVFNKGETTSKFVAPQDTGSTVNFGPAVRMILAKRDQVFLSEDLLKDQANWVTGILVGDILPLLENFGLENSSVDKVEQEGIFSKIKVKDGITSVIVTYAADNTQVNQLKKINVSDWNVYLVHRSPTGGNSIVRFTPANEACTEFKGFNLSQADVGNIVLSTGDEVETVNVEFTWSESTELSGEGLYLGVDFNAENLEALRITKVITTGTPTVTEVKAFVGEIMGGLGIAGSFASPADWILVDSAGLEQTIVGVDDDGEGNYTLDVTTLASGTFTLNIQTPDVTQDKFLSDRGIEFTV